MVATKIRADFRAAIGDDHTAATASYAALGTTDAEAFQLIVTSTLNEAVWLSFDGSTDHLYIPRGSGSGGGGGSISTPPIAIQFAANKQQDGRMSLAKGTTIYIKDGEDGSPSAGDIYISIISAE